MRRCLVIFVAAYCASSIGFTQPAPSAPRLVLVLTIDQMRFDYLARFEPLYKGGLRTLLDRGAVFTNANYRHASTETGPGHSVVLSGRHPSHSGIVANEWYDSYLRRPVNVVDDPTQQTLGGPGRAASPANALSVTVGDVLKAKQPKTRIVGVSLKDRSAILMGGRRADAAYWFENEGGNFVTSTYYMKTAPAWLTDWNRARSVDRFAGRVWTRLLDDVSIYDRYSGPDAVSGERDGKDIAFPHALAASPPQTAYYAELRRTPYGDELTLDLALEAMKEHDMGRDPDTDILAIGFAATDGVGHAYGPDSHELLDHLLRLDILLERLFQHIDRTVGLTNSLVVVTADHGSRQLVEFVQMRGGAARRVSPVVLEKAVSAAFAKKYPGVTDLISYFATDIYLDDEVMRRHRLEREEVEQTAIEALLSTGVVERVYTHDDLRSTAPSSDPFLPLFQNAFFEPRSPHLNVLLKKDVNLTASAWGTGHGSAYEFDRHVPLVFMGQRIVPGRYADASGPEDIAPTLAHLLQLTFPRERDARVLMEMIHASRAR